MFIIIPFIALIFTSLQQTNGTDGKKVSTFTQVLYLNTIYLQGTFYFVHLTSTFYFTTFIPQLYLVVSCTYKTQWVPPQRPTTLKCILHIITASLWIIYYLRYNHVKLTWAIFCIIIKYYIEFTLLLLLDGV